MSETKLKVIKKIYDWLELSVAKTNVLYGGAGSGKSYTVAQFLIFEKLLSERNKRILISRKTNPSLKDSAYLLVLDLLNEYGIPYEHNKSEQVITVRDNRVMFRSMDNPEKIKSSEYNYIWLEEATDFSIDDFRQISLRLRRATDSENKLFLTFNPISTTNWVYRNFFEREYPNSAKLKTTFQDNPFLPEDYIESLTGLKHQDENYYLIYALGEFGVLKNLIYNFRAISSPPDHFDEVFWGLDFGFNNPTALIKIGLYDGAFYVIDEVYRRGLTNSDLIALMRENVSPNENIYADSAEPNRIEEIAREGFRIYPAKKNVRDGIDYVKAQTVYVSQRCVNVLKEKETYKWKEDKDGNVLDEPVKFNDHAMDAIRYAIYTHTEAVKISTARIDL